MVRSCYQTDSKGTVIPKTSSNCSCHSSFVKTMMATQSSVKGRSFSCPWMLSIFLFICLINNGLAAQASTSAKIPSPSGKPRIIQSSPPLMYAREGKSIHLVCSVTGTPTPKVQWYNADTGKPVVTRNANVDSNHFALKNDLLITGLNERNQGHYYCNASNIHGFTISHNITLALAFLNRKFKHSPQNKNAREGETVQMECRPPKGIPPPKVTWLKDGKKINIVNGDQHYIIQKNGDLRINHARLLDRGRYRCVATNVYGYRRSKPAILEVRRKPQFIRQPQDVLAAVNSNAQFHCVVAGDPPPVIIWRREDGSRLVSSRRTMIMNDKSLVIKRVQLSDEGKYVCNATNSAGRLEAVAKLTVSAPPSFYRTPDDQVAAIGQRVTFHCVVSGRPKPQVYWETPDGTLLWAANMRKDSTKNMQVYDDGRLVIKSATKANDGRYVCHANSYFKQIRSTASLTVEDRELHPPPVIDLGPQNQTLLEGSNAILRCIATPLDPRPKLEWYKGSLRMVLDFKDHRIIMQSNGVLQIADVKVEDSANYTCVVTLGPYKTRWSATLRVLAKTEPISALYQLVRKATEEFSLFPRKPTRLKVTDFGDTWTVLSWEVAKPSYRGSSAPVLSYQIEQFTPSDNRGWVVLEPHCKDMKYKVRNLKPKTKYYFLVRASNIHGLGRPFRVREAVETLPKRNLLQGAIMNKPSIVNTVRVTSLRLQVTGHDTIKVIWNVKGPDENLRAVSGFVVRYKPVMLTRCIIVQQEDMVSYTYCSLKPPLFQQLSRELSQNGYSFLKETRELRQTVEEHVSRQTSRVATIIKDLQPFHCYEVDVVPFFYNENYGRITGRVSAARKALTYDSVPSQPPISTAAKWLSNTTVELRWGPPPLDSRNGVVTGFNVHVIGNETRFNKFVKTNSSVHSVVLKTMNPRIPYTIHLAARTCKGEGIRSMALKLNPIPQSRGNHFLREPWFIGTVVGCGLLWVVLCIITIIVCKRYMQQKRLPYKPVLPAYSNGTLKERGGNVPGAGGLVMQNIDGSVAPPPDLTNMLQEKGQHRDLILEDGSMMSGGPGCLPQVAAVINPVSPYATTSLITNQAFHPPAYSNSDTTSAGKASSSTCNYVPPAHMGCANTGQYSDGMGCRSCSDCGSQATADELEAIMANSAMRGQPQPQTVPQQQRWPNSTTPPRHKMLNIGEIIPPPPEYPPPPPGGNVTSATTPSSQNSGEQQGQPRGYRETTKSPPTEQRKAGDPHHPPPGVTSPALSGRVSSIGTRSSASGGANSTSNVYHQLMPPAEQARLHQEHPQEAEEDGDYSDLSDRCESPDFHSSLLGEASETCPSALASAYSDSVESEDPDMSSVVSSVASEDEAFLRPGERDFATSVQMAADAHRRRGANRNHYHKPGSRRHQRSHSPGYSTDSTNYGVLPSPKKPYPKSQRRRQHQAKAAANPDPQIQTIPAYAFGNHPVA